MRLLLTRLPNGQYLATSPDVPGLVAQGRTESEATIIAQRWNGNWTGTATWHVCTDPSHPPLFQFPQHETLYQKLRAKTESLAGSRPSDRQAVDAMLDEAEELLHQPSGSGMEGYRVQDIRRHVSDEWGSVLCRLENLTHIAMWYINSRFDGKHDDPLQFVLRLLALEATRTVFATVHLLRGALATETFGHWRTLYESYVYSQFLFRFSNNDPDLPGRFLRCTNFMYIDFCERFGPKGDGPEADHSWNWAEEFHSRHPIRGKGNYAWAYPGIAKRKPTFRDIAEAVDGGSTNLELYYKFATSKTHGRFILGFDGIRPTRVASIGSDPFSTGGINAVLEFSLPLFAAVIENAIAPSATDEPELVLDIVRAVIERLTDDIASKGSADPEK